MPPAVRLYAPDATGGTAVQRTYLETPRGNEVLAGLAAGALAEMSYAYDPKQWDFEEAEGARFPTIRNLYKSDLLDISDVNWGLNSATSADGRKGQPLEIEHQAVLAAVDAHIKRYQALASLRAKEGRVLSDANRKRIADAIDALAGASTALKDLLAATEPQKASHSETNALRAAWAVRQQSLRELGVFV